ncbi:hypothetical protein PG984_013315 [Apiospora sp. TS-2023a]
MGDHKHKSGSSKHHDNGKHSRDVHLGHSSSSRDKKKSSTKSLRWNCSQCGNGNNSLALTDRCPICQSYRGPYDVVYPEEPSPYISAGQNNVNATIEQRKHGISIGTNAVKVADTELHARPRFLDNAAQKDTDSFTNAIALGMGAIKSGESQQVTDTASVDFSRQQESKMGQLAPEAAIFTDTQNASSKPKWLSLEKSDLTTPNLNTESMSYTPKTFGVWHLHQDKYLHDVEADVTQFLQLLPEELLVIPVKTYYPLNAGLMPPSDPHPLHLSSVGELQHEVVEQILDTFQEAIGFYLLINGMLQIIVPDDFDISTALNYYPGRFGGLKVSYAHHGQIPTAGEEHDLRETSSTHRSHLVSQTQDVMESSAAATPSGSGSSNLVPKSSGSTTGQGLFIGCSVRAYIPKEKSRYRHQAKLGLMTKAQTGIYLTLPTHLVTEVLNNSGLDWKWPRSGYDDVRLEAGNNHIELGPITNTFDPNAGESHDFWEHDVSLVEVSSLPSAVRSGMKPCMPLEWLSDNEWTRLQLNTTKLFLLDDKDRSAKSIGMSLSEFQMVGQGIFVNRQKSNSEKSKRRSILGAFRRGKNKQDTESEMEACKNKVARSVLYRVAQDYEAPGGQSGTPVCLLDDSEPGEQKGKVAGFTSYVQMVQDIQHYNVEGEHLMDMLEKGRVVFYGAFKVPREMREEHIII